MPLRTQVMSDLLLMLSSCDVPLNALDKQPFHPLFVFLRYRHNRGPFSMLMKSDVFTDQALQTDGKYKPL
ncbi:hypothetical protein NQ318_015551 [Aromia moschata]|uniref:Uncharacterized protein n=1 Tax=Aromia moschata TaxID=1265417 RepID=A0AAV8YA74_9CUCU|nr:hypothetical protein NQ318_015551 [Aromia moschata]